MSKSTRNAGTHWSGDEVAKMRQLAKHNTPTGVIGMKLGRSKQAIWNKASEEGLSLKPVNRHPYGRRK